MSSHVLYVITLLSRTNPIDVMVAIPATANQYSQWKSLLKYAPSPASFRESPHPSKSWSSSHPSPPPRSHSSGLQLLMAAGQASFIPIILSGHTLPTIPVGEVEHYTAECLMSHWRPFSSNVLIRLYFRSPHTASQGRKWW